MILLPTVTVLMTVVTVVVVKRKNTHLNIYYFVLFSGGHGNCPFMRLCIVSTPLKHSALGSISTDIVPNKRTLQNLFLMGGRKKIRCLLHPKHGLSTVPMVNFGKNW